MQDLEKSISECKKIVAQLAKSIEKTDKRLKALDKVSETIEMIQLSYNKEEAD